MHDQLKGEYTSKLVCFLNSRNFGNELYMLHEFEKTRRKQLGAQSTITCINRPYCTSTTQKDPTLLKTISNEPRTIDLPIHTNE